MKKLLLIAIVLLFPTVAFAQIYCYWTGTEGTNCQTLPTDRNWIRAIDGHKISLDVPNLNNFGFYELVETKPALGTDQTYNAPTWGFTGSQITKTWTVRDMTATEIDQRDSGAMPLTEYLIWKLLVNKGVVTAAEIRTYMETNYPEVIDAFEARDRLENP